jgi:hypothetical protein
MTEIIKKLAGVAGNLESAGLHRTAGLIDQISSRFLKIKTAQYVGTQGYWIRNTRCWEKCYRIKRAEKPEMPTQEIWFECQKEYVEALNDEDHAWAKYADPVPANLRKFANTNKLANKVLEQERNYFHKESAKKINQGLSIENAITQTIENGTDRYYFAIASEVEKLASLVSKLEKSGQKENAQKV